MYRIPELAADIEESLADGEWKLLLVIISEPCAGQSYNSSIGQDHTSMITVDNPDAG
jgi:hypothetical protein